MMNNQTDRFYNMQVNLIKNGTIYTEKVAVLNVWEKDDTVFLSLFFHRLHKTYVFDSVFVRDIWDINREVGYVDMRQFAKAFQEETQKSAEDSSAKEALRDKELLAPLKNDVIILLFMSQILGKPNPLQSKIICDYIKKNFAKAQNLSESYLTRYISRFKPAAEDFYAALQVMKSKQPRQAESLLHEAIKICLVDGYLHYLERVYLSDMIQTLRQEGLKLPANLI
jgi:hypothetical protein